MTDSSKYTGIHKARFDEDGHGRGIAGRDLAGKGDSIKLCHLRVIGLAALNVFCFAITTQRSGMLLRGALDSTTCFLGVALSSTMIFQRVSDTY